MYIYIHLINIYNIITIILSITINTIFDKITTKKTQQEILKLKS